MSVLIFLIILSLGKNWVFWLNIAKNEVYWCYRYYSKLFGKMRKETEFRQQSCRNCKKKYNVSGERENWISVMRLPKFLSYPSSAHEVPQVHARGSAKRENNCGNLVAEIVGIRREKTWIVETKFLKMGGKKKKNCDNQVAENEGKKMLRSQHFYIIFTTNYRWLIIIGSNLNLTLRLRFCPNNNNQ